MNAKAVGIGSDFVPLHKIERNMSKIFCLETEWIQSVHDLKTDSYVKPLLDFLYTTGIYNGIDAYTFRNVCCKEDFNYYMEHLRHKSYYDYNIVYLAFHGDEGGIEFPADRKQKHLYTLRNFADEHEGIFKERPVNVHFGSCLTMNTNEEDILYFKNKTGANMVTGYERSVPFVESFIFETWLMNAMAQHPDYRAVRMQTLADKEMAFYVDKLKFKAY